MSSIHNEDQCTFVSTVGLSLVADQKPVYNGRQVVYSINFENNPGDIVYIKSTHFSSFLEHIPKFRCPIIIIANGDDNYFPSDFQNLPSFSNLHSDKVIALFMQNTWLVNHPKFKGIPIGIDYHTLNWERGQHQWGNTNQTALDQEAVLKACMDKMLPLKDCDPTKVLTNFHLAMDSPPRRKVLREHVYKCVKDTKWMVWLPSMSREEFWMQCKDKVFVLCPPGNGPDTHRAWEVLMLGRIPIIQQLTINDVYADLPVWVVSEWRKFGQLTEDDFKNKFQEFINKWDIFKFEKLTMKYWRDYIRSFNQQN